jgi:lipid-A-disaccharide synthase
MPGRIAVLCGSRASEVRRTGCVLIQSAAAWIERHPGWQAQAIEAPGLEPSASRELRRCATACGVEVVQGDDGDGAAGLLHNFDLALCVSGTASLEAAASGALPLVAYRFDALSAAVARRVLRTSHIALPNVILGERAFAELVQDEVSVERVVKEAETMLTRWESITDAARRVREAMQVQAGGEFGERLAGMITPAFCVERPQGV